ncbi:MAG: hypothetical protein V1872_02265 [bacterium]
MEDMFSGQLGELAENERMYYVYNDYQRRLTRYRGLDNFFKKKHKMSFENFEKEIIPHIEEYNLEVKCDAYEWRDVFNQIKILEGREKALMDDIFWSLGIVVRNTLSKEAIALKEEKDNLEEYS